MTDALSSCCQMALLDHHSLCSARRQDRAGVAPVEVRVTRYQVSCLPVDHEDASLFTLVVHVCSHGRWAVARGIIHHDADGGRSAGVRWEDEREPVTDEEAAAYHRAYEAWVDAYHFDELDALDIARRLAPAMRYRGYTVADALAQSAQSIPETTEGGPR